MNYIASAVLLLWLPIVVMGFQVVPPRKAVAYLSVIAWLFLPNSSFSLPGLPDYGKMTATVIGVLLSVAIFDSRKFFSIRPRWYDIPMVVWCLENFVTAIANDLGVYEATSSLVDSTVIWGCPYLIGRLYLTDLDALKEFGQAIVFGGILYIPLCLLEVRFSPVLHQWVYGFGTHRLAYYQRYGGYRPSVFLTSGLELGMWMTNSTLMCYVLWSFGTVKKIRGFSMGMVTLALVATSILCKSTGALGMLALGIGILWTSKRFGKTWLLWVVIAISPVYCVVRATDIWSGQDVVQISSSLLNEDRAESFNYRLRMERLLADRALQRPAFGWGRMGRNLISNANGSQVTVPDGLWIIELGIRGILGLTCLLALFLLPMILTIRRYPISTWKDPQVGPVVGLSLIIVLTMVDFLSNAMMMPLYPLIIGGLLTQEPYRQENGEHVEAAEALSIASEFTGEGRMIEAGQEFHRAIVLAGVGDDTSARQIQAEALDGLGHSNMAVGHLEDAVEAFQAALIIRDELAAHFHDDDHFRDLAIARDGLSRALAELGRTAEAVEERRHALQIWEILAANHPKNGEFRDHQVNTLNDLAWLLATGPAPSPDDLALALALAEDAVRISPDHEALWNTLGVARYRAGDWAGAIEALERSAITSPDGAGTAFDHYFLAMAWYQLRREDLAGEWLERGIAWAARHRPGHPTLDRFEVEAASLLRGEI